MHKSKRVASVYGKVRVVDGWQGHRRLWVKRTNIKTYVLSSSERLSLESMVSVGGKYHFNTLKQLHEDLNNAVLLTK